MGEKIPTVLVFLITVALFVIVVAGMRAAAAIMNPFLLAVFLATLCAPPLFYLERLGVPKGLAVGIILLGLFVVALLLMVFVGRSLNTMSQQLPVYQERLGVLMTQIYAWLDGLGLDMGKAAPLADYFSPRKVFLLVSYGLSIFRVLFTHMFLILLTVLFILIEAAGFSRKLRAAAADPDRTLSHFKTMTDSVNRYMGIKALFSMATGCSIWLLLTVLGVDFASTWGLLAFLLNFIPSIGSFIAAIPAILLALIQLGLPTALVAMLGYLVVNVLFGNILEPRFMGQRLGLSPLVVFLSLLFWGWVLGPIGMVLSVPLTMIVKIALATDADTRWLAIMLE
jgi:AI-2 transport protein TqsA